MRVSWILVYDTQGDDPAGRGCGRRQGRSDGEEIDVEPDEEDCTLNLAFCILHLKKLSIVLISVTEWF